MIKQRIVCNVLQNTVTREWVEDTESVGIDFGEQILECLQELAKTDYVAIKIAEGAATREEYRHVLEQRAALRARIGELEQLQAQATA